MRRLSECIELLWIEVIDALYDFFDYIELYFGVVLGGYCIGTCIFQVAKYTNNIQEVITLMVLTELINSLCFSPLIDTSNTNNVIFGLKILNGIKIGLLFGIISDGFKVGS